MRKIDFEQFENFINDETSKVLNEVFGKILINENELRLQRMISNDINARGNLRSAKNDKESINQQKEADKEKSDETDSSKEPEKKKKEKVEDDIFSVDASANSEEKTQKEKPEGGKGGGTANSEKFEIPDDKELSNPSFDKFKEALALLRGGRSASDSEVSKALQNYYERELETQDRQKIYAFFFGVAQILSKVASSKEAMDPDMLQKLTGGISSKLEPEKAKLDKKTLPSLPGGPIIVGEAQRKESVLEVFRGSKL